MKKIIFIIILFSLAQHVNIYGQVWQFEVFTSQNYDIPEGIIEHLVVDKSDNKWITINKGICCFDPERSGFEYFELSYDSQGMECFEVDNDDNLWIGGLNGLFKFTASDSSPNFITEACIFSIAIDSKSNVWGLEPVDWIHQPVLGLTKLLKYDGNNWESIDTLSKIFTGYILSWVEIDNEDNLWIGGHGPLIKFDGFNWKTFNLPDSIDVISSFTVDEFGNKWMGTGGQAYNSVDGNGVVKLSANDSTWTVYNTSNSGLTSNAVWNISIDGFGNKWMATSPEGDNVSRKGGGLVKFDGNEWIIYDSLNSALPTNIIHKVLVDSKNNKWLLIDGHHGHKENGQLAVFNENGIIVGISENARLYNSPVKYLLSQNYPNPFNPSTKISYSISNQSHVSLKVFDVLGREITTLVDDIQTSGNYSIDFDASGLTSGIYFYRIQAGDFVESKKMVLMK